jgi:chemotaxis protein MotA
VDIATFLGIISAFGLVGMAIVSQGNFAIFLDWPSALIVLGGTLGATMINYPLKDILGVFKVVKKVFVYKEDDYTNLIPKMVRYSTFARKDGLLGLEKYLGEIDDQFFYEGIRMIVDGIAIDSIKQVMQTEIDFQVARHRVGISIFQTMGQFAPAFGMVGTLIGLILMLRSMDNPAMIAQSMAISLVATFYGATLANIVFLPIAGKLKERSTAEILKKEMILAGILAIHAGDIPGIVEQRMVSFLPTAYRRLYSEEKMR